MKRESFLMNHAFFAHSTVTYAGSKPGAGMLLVAPRGRLPEQNVIRVEDSSLMCLF
jgi:hypothetical protein